MMMNVKQNKVPFGSISHTYGVLAQNVTGSKWWWGAIIIMALALKSDQVQRSSRQ